MPNKVIIVRCSLRAAGTQLFRKDSASASAAAASSTHSRSILTFARCVVDRGRSLLGSKFCHDFVVVEPSGRQEGTWV